MYEVESCIRGFHVYHAVWTPYLREQLDCVLDSGNSEDPFAVAVQKASETIGRGRSLVSPHSSCDGTERYAAQLRGIEEEAMIYRRAVSKYLVS